MWPKLINKSKGQAQTDRDLRLVSSLVTSKRQHLLYRPFVDIPLGRATQAAPGPESKPCVSFPGFSPWGLPPVLQSVARRSKTLQSPWSAPPPEFCSQWNVSNLVASSFWEIKAQDVKWVPLNQKGKKSTGTHERTPSDFQVAHATDWSVTKANIKGRAGPWLILV